jgi:hypothetical protein
MSGTIESIIVPVGIVLCKSVAGNLYKPLNFLLFIILATIYTVLIMLYRCRLKTPKKPEIQYSKTWLALVPLLIWGVIGLALPYIKFKIPPQILMILIAVTSSIGLYIISFIAYNGALKYTVIPQCYPETILDKIFNFIWKILGAIGSIF